MHGNVWEWTSDWFSADYFRNSPIDDPQGPASGTHHTLRGGSASVEMHECRTTIRGEAGAADGPDENNGNRYPLYGDFGVRVVCISESIYPQMADRPAAEPETKKPAKAIKKGEVNKGEEIRKVANGMKAKGEMPRPVVIIDMLKKQGIVVSSPQVSMVLKRMGFRPRDDDGEDDQEVISSVADLMNALSGMEKTSRIRIRVEVDGEVSGYMKIDKVEVVDDGVEISTWD